jgi:hypothetical protein
VFIKEGVYHTILYVFKATLLRFLEGKLKGKYLLFSVLFGRFQGNFTG